MRHLNRGKITGTLLLNLFILQFLFIRLARVSAMEEINSGEFIQTHWSLLIGIVPLTGWRSPYIYVFKKQTSLIIIKLRHPRLIKL